MIFSNRVDGLSLFEARNRTRIRNPIQNYNFSNLFRVRRELFEFLSKISEIRNPEPPGPAGRVMASQVVARVLEWNRNELCRYSARTWQSFGALYST